MSEPRRFVIVGAMLCGARAAGALREQGFDGEVVLIGSEPDPPYERPPLSKDYLRGEHGFDDARVHDGRFYEEHSIGLRTSTTVTALDLDAGEVELEGGERLGFERLLLATGADVRRLDVPGAGLEGIHYLRTREDSDRLQDELRRASRAVIVGGGWIGLEVAASARQMGVEEVTVVEMASLPLLRVLGPRLGEFYRDVHTDHDVRFHFERQLERFEGAGRVERVVLAGDTTLECDLAVVGVGVAPRVELAQQAGLAVDNGVLVDGRLATSDPRVFAAGDVANHDHPRYGRLRVEHWANARHQGPAAARSMLGGSEPYDRLPYFYSDQYDVGMEYLGLSAPDDEVVIRGDLQSRELIAFWQRDGRVTAAMNVNIWDVQDQLQALISSDARVDAERLRDADVPLEQLA